MRGSCRSLLFSATTLLLAASSAFTSEGQTNPVPPGGRPAQTSAAETLHAGAQLVVVDVVVQDRDGRPYHGLTRDDFLVTEQKRPQTIRNFEEHAANTAQKPGPPGPPMPPGVFTDYTPVAPGSTLNILLVDTLNTPMQDQSFVREQLLKYVKNRKPGAPVAVFGLMTRLYMLQGFTSDPAVLQAVLEHQLTPRGSSLLNDPVGGGGGPESMSSDMQEAGNGELAGVLKQMEADEHSTETTMRAEYTLDAFNALGHYLSNFPGRKNLIWFSGSFPLNIGPDSSLKNPFAVMADSNEEFRETTNLLENAQVAVYPVDARGLMTSPMFNASNSGAEYARDPRAITRDVQKFTQNQTDEHSTMDRMASDTGGQAFYNTNGISDAVAKAIETGSNYYTVAYSPSDRDAKGYRNIHVELTGAFAAQGYKLAYRHGYYADDPQKPPTRSELPTQVAPASSALTDHASDPYLRSATSFGAPTPADILFKVGVAPLNGKDDDPLAPGNHADPNGRMKPPYRTFAVNYVTLPGQFSMALESDGRHVGKLEFSAMVYDADGKLLNIAGAKANLNLPPDAYKRFLSSPLRFHLMVSAPAKQASFLRIIVRDVPADHYGVVEVPTAEVAHLPPLVAQMGPSR